MQLLGIIINYYISFITIYSKVPNDINDILH